MARNDRAAVSPHTVKVSESSEPDWYLQAWAEREGKRQSDLVSDLGWLKNHAHRIWHSKQPYRRDIVNAVSAWLGIEPYELLMEPERAIQLRRFTETAYAIAADRDRPFVAAPAVESSPAPGRGSVGSSTGARRRKSPVTPD